MNDVECQSRDFFLVLTHKWNLCEDFYASSKYPKPSLALLDNSFEGIKQSMKQAKLANKKIIFTVLIICILTSAGLATALYSNYVWTISEKEKNITTLNSQLIKLRAENQTALLEALNASLTANITILQNQIADYEALIDSLRDQIALLEAHNSSNTGQTNVQAEIALLEQQISDIQTQIGSKQAEVASLNEINARVMLENLNNTAIWLDQTKSAYLKLAEQTVGPANRLSTSGLNLVPGRIYFLTFTLESSSGSNGSASLYVNSDEIDDHYDSMFIYANPQWSWPSRYGYHYGDDAQIFDSSFMVGSSEVIFAGILEIDPIGTLRMGLSFNAVDVASSDSVEGFYGWTYNGTTVQSVNRLDLVSTIPITGTLAIYDTQS